MTDSAVRFVAVRVGADGHRGWCGHRHRLQAAAIACADQIERGWPNPEERWDVCREDQLRLERREAEMDDDDYVELTGDDIPPHLRDDAPVAVCGRCGRESVTEESFGQEDRMTQPDGYPCGGMFSDPRSGIKEP